MEDIHHVPQEEGIIPLNLLYTTQKLTIKTPYHIYVKILKLLPQLLNIIEMISDLMAIKIDCFGCMGLKNQKPEAYAKYIGIFC